MGSRSSGGQTRRPGILRAPVRCPHSTRRATFHGYNACQRSSLAVGTRTDLATTLRESPSRKRILCSEASSSLWLSKGLLATWMTQLRHCLRVPTCQAGVGHSGSPGQAEELSSAPHLGSHTSKGRWGGRGRGRVCCQKPPQELSEGETAAPKDARPSPLMVCWTSTAHGAC